MSDHQQQSQPTQPQSGWAPFQGHLTWSEIQTIVTTQSFETFSRTPKVLESYVSWRESVLETYVSIPDFIKVEKLEFGKVEVWDDIEGKLGEMTKRRRRWAAESLKEDDRVERMKVSEPAALYLPHPAIDHHRRF
jgi:hypothetical protein